MGVLKDSKNQTFLVGDSNNAQAKGKQRGKEKKKTDSKPKEKLNPLDGASSSKKNKNKMFEKTKFSYYMRGFHPESQCMKNTIDQMSKLLKQNNIVLPQAENKSEAGNQTEEHERLHSLKSCFTQSKTLFD